MSSPDRLVDRDALRGKRALVTGGGVRLGRAIALALADAGAHVAVHYHQSIAGAQQVAAKIHAQGGQAFTVSADLSREEGAARMFQQVDAVFDARLDVLVNSAGIIEKLDLADMSVERWTRMFATNVESALHCSLLAQERMLTAGEGAIVNLTDISAERPWRGYAHYCASKAALVSLTRSLALEWAPRIRVNGVSPGAVLPPDEMHPEEIERLAANVPQKRLGT
ncbi:MAG TPA: SDR family NAD(P)-dependent oxidoreductase, partial [bacterium]|nr:SDR family NAD(P)-dependent oxidoreductase [bacterium]